jgi:hypothetical protein
MKDMFFKGKKKAERAAIATADERAITRILFKCDYKLERVVKYILAAEFDKKTCEYCVAKTIAECDKLGTCAPAVAAYLRERDGHA